MIRLIIIQILYIHAQSAPWVVGFHFGVFWLLKYTLECCLVSAIIIWFWFLRVRRALLSCEVSLCSPLKSLLKEGVWVRETNESLAGKSLEDSHFQWPSSIDVRFLTRGMACFWLSWMKRVSPSRILRFVPLWLPLLTFQPPRTAKSRSLWKEQK